MNQPNATTPACENPDCGCTTPAFTQPMEALEFLSGRFKFAGVSEGVAMSYAQDIDAILKQGVEEVGLISKNLMDRLRSLDDDCVKLNEERQVSLKVQLLEDLRDAMLIDEPEQDAQDVSCQADTRGWSIEVKPDRDGEMGVWAVNDGSSIWLAKV